MTNPAHEGSLHDDRSPPDLSKAPDVAVFQPKDPRTKYKYNIFCRFFLLWVCNAYWEYDI